MNILQICNKVPFPPKDGGCIAMNNLTNGLVKQGFNVKVLAINTPKHFVKMEQLPAEYRSKTQIEAVFVDTDLKPMDALVHLIRNESYNLSRFYSREFEEKLIEILKKDNYEIVQLESLYVSMYMDVIRKHSKAKIILRAHNIENMIWKRKSILETNPLKKIYISILQKQLLKKELEVMEKVDAVLPITGIDADWIMKNSKQRMIKVIPFGIDLSEYKLSSDQPERQSVFFIGSFDWFPNVDGLIWFIEKVWDKINQNYPDANLYIAGRGMSDSFKKINKKNLHILGEVADVKKIMTSKQIMIVPLFTAGGMRVKIIEGMATGKVIISTSIGAEGIDAFHEKDIMIANNEEEFLNAVKKCFSDEQLMLNISANARVLAEKKYNNDQLSADLAMFYKEL